mmetsp:Transcript_51208/g.52164  ORF Transcript_51208/g.52164 Transcript_51208/m.52164 type:complete len:90 (+) Transcript_51208:3-272(+)
MFSSPPPQSPPLTTPRNFLSPSRLRRQRGVYLGLGLGFSSTPPQSPQPTLQPFILELIERNNNNNENTNGDGDGDGDGDRVGVGDGGYR